MLVGSAMYEPSGKITRGRCNDDEFEEGGVAIDVAVLLLSVLLLMVEKELRLEIVLVLIEELKCRSDLVELAKETKRRASSSPSISNH